MNQPIKPSPLGRGLSALFGDADASYAPPRPVVVAAPAPVAESKASPTQLAVTWLQPGAFQPRRHFDDEALKGLSGSIKERGILEPLVVRPIAGQKDQYEIIAGERRWRAAQMAGLHDVPVVVRNLTDREALEFGLIENVQRQDLSPLEEAEGYQRLMQEFQHTHEGLAKIIGKSRAHIGNMMRILVLPLEVKQMIEKGELTMGHARALVPTADPLQLAKIIVKKGLNVRQAEALAQRYLSGETSLADPKPAMLKIDYAIQGLERDLAKLLGYKVKITQKGRGGSFAVFYENLDQLDTIIARLKRLQG